jgi:non-specific serine/threonine protein kinase
MERDGTAAHRALQASLAIAEQLHDQWWQAWILHALGRVAYFDNDARQARQHGQQSLVIAETLGDEWLRAWALHLLGLAAYIGHDYPSAEAYYAQALAIRRELGHLEGIVIVLILKGMIPHRGGDLPAALALYREALELARELNSAWFIRSALPHLASLAADSNPERAARLGGAVTGMSESSHTLPIPVTEALFNEGIQTARRRLGETAFAQAWADGRAMSLDAIIAEALAIEVAPRGPYPAQLTAAEVEVLRRLASGCSTRQIAAELVIAISTVDRHITHIYEKIGRRGRAFATAFALEHGLAEGNPSNSRPT